MPFNIGVEFYPQIVCSVALLMISVLVSILCLKAAESIIPNAFLRSLLAVGLGLIL